MRKITVLFLALVIILGSMPAMPMAASAAGLTLDEGYTFIDIAHKTDDNGNITYVATAKGLQPGDIDYALTFYSTDGGITWAKSAVQPNRYGASISFNRKSQQELVWWEAKGLFVLHGPGDTWTSPDGNTWEKNANIHWATNTVFTASGDYLVYGAGDPGRLNATNNLEEKKFVDNILKLDQSAASMMAVGVKDTAEAGKKEVFGFGLGHAYHALLDTTGAKCTWKVLDSNSGGDLPSHPYDMVYTKNSDKFLAIDGSENLLVASDSNNFRVYPVKTGVKITGIGASDTYIVAGMEDGTMYYTANNEAGITENTVWTEIPAESGTTACTEPVKCIEFSDDSHFLVLGATQIYKGNVSNYTNVKEHRALEKPQISKGNTFAGIKLIGGTYAKIAGQDVYVVYGNTTGATPQGKLFVKEGSADWELVYTDDCIFSTEKNGAVWWAAKNMFVVSMAHNSNPSYGRLLTSADGRTWTPVDGTVTDFRNGTNMQVLGDHLYAANNGKGIYKYSELDKNTRETIALSDVIPTTGPQYYSQIAVGDSADNPAMFFAGGYQAVIRNNEQEAENETDKWKFLSGIGNADALDAVYSENSKKFVVLVNGNLRTSIITKEGTVVQGPVVAGGIICNAIDTNGSDFMFAGADGNVYTAPDTEDFKKFDESDGSGYKLTKVSAASGTTENKMSVTNVFKAGADTFIATASDNTDSDVLVLKKTGSAYEYTKPSDNTKLEGIVPGDTVNVSVKGINLRAEAYPFSMVTAVYAADGTLLQVQTNAFEIPAQSDGTTVRATVTWNDDLTGDETIKVFMWNSLTGMVPAAIAATNPF